MKRLAVCLLVLGLLFIALSADENEVIKQAGKFFQQKEYDKALQLIDEEIKKSTSSENLLRIKYIILMRMEKYGDALTLLDQVIKDKGEDPQFVGEKVRLLKRMEKYEDALKTALHLEKISKVKSPWNSLEIAEIFIKLKNNDKAFEWLTTAVERGFNSLAEFRRNKTLRELSADPRYNKIIAKIKENIGLDKPAKDFTVKLLSGEDFQLSKQKGKVILIDFWATWCGPCRNELPNLKEHYKSLKDKGFEIIGISLDRTESALKKFLADDPLPWKLSFSGKFWEDETANLYGVKAIPSYWLIDKKGVLRYFGIRGKALKKAVEELLAEK